MEEMRVLDEVPKLTVGLTLLQASRPCGQPRCELSWTFLFGP